MLVRSFEDNDRVSSKIKNVREILEIEEGILLENGKVVNQGSAESFEDSFLFVLEPESGDINEEMDPTEMESEVCPCS